MRDLMLKYNGISGEILQQNSTNHCKNFNQFTAQCDTLTHVNFPTFAMADPRYGGLIRMTSDCHHLSQIRKGTIQIKQTNLLQKPVLVRQFVPHSQTKPCEIKRYNQLTESQHYNVKKYAMKQTSKGNVITHNHAVSSSCMKRNFKMYQNTS